MATYNTESTSMSGNLTPTTTATSESSGLPAGWISQFSHDHGAWYYVNTATGLTQWEPPAAVTQHPIPNEPVKHDQSSPGPYTAGPNSSTPTIQGYAGQEHYTQPQGGQGHETQWQQTSPADGPDGDRGLGKTAMVVGGGLLAAAGMMGLREKSTASTSDKLSGFMGGSSKPPQQNQQQYYPPQQQQQHQQSYGPGPGAAPMPPPGNYGQQQPQYSSWNPSGGYGQTSVMPAQSSIPPLNIYGAVFADQDVTSVARSLAARDQTLSLKGDTLVKQFGNLWPETARKSFSMLYSYGDRPMELIVADTESGIIEVKPEALSKKRMDFCQAPPSRVIALLWGITDASTLGRRQQIEKDGEMESAQDQLGDGGFWAWEPRTLVCYWRADDGQVHVTISKQGGTLRMPWNSLAKWN
ncbi:hypothetical protein NQ176_g9493 [Zarea fungicola]|uniref:Uncharacterized protein n=1 Tax=Zarea fungicola TaxID=93591 RepID=A0ACC1MMD8_9HYPO|nr:hypothetical protein NQ176_g9493 [Lecanicillium fungicola]